MTKKQIAITRSVVLTGALFFACDVFAQETKTASGKAKNVILVIADGMGFNSDVAGTMYRFGEEGKQQYHSFPIALGCTTFSRARPDAEIPPGTKGYDPTVFWLTLANSDQSTEFTRKTDSGAAATALASGVKVTNGKIGVDSQNNPVELISEVAVKLGKKAGCVTTVAVNHPTPACFAAHSNSRANYHEIFRKMTAKDSPVSVLMGGGHPFFDRGAPIKIKENETEKARNNRYKYIDPEIWETLSKGELNGFTYIETKEQFDALAAGKEPLPQKVIGIARTSAAIPPSDGFLEDMPETREFLEKSYSNMKWEAFPTLAAMSLGAINILNRNNDQGFFLMIEGGAIDGANHAQNMPRNIQEHIGFARAVEAVINWIETESSWEETLLIITADHETGLIWGAESYSDDNENGVFDEGDTFGDFEPLQSEGRGQVPQYQYASKGHTNSLVPLWAKGVGSGYFKQKIRGNDKKAGEMWGFSGDYIDNIDIFETMKQAMCY